MATINRISLETWAFMIYACLKRDKPRQTWPENMAFMASATTITGFMVIASWKGP